jgi:hypothetical protein
LDVLESETEGGGVEGGEGSGGGGFTGSSGSAAVFFPVLFAVAGIAIVMGLVLGSSVARFASSDADEFPCNQKLEEIEN